MLNNQNFINRLKKVLSFYNISAANFAETIDVPRSSISHILSGRNKPSLEFVLKIIETYQEIDLYWLLKGIGTFPKNNTTTPPREEKIIQPLKVIPEKEKEPETEKEKENTKQEESISQKITTPETSTKTIHKVLFFYTDGTFEEFNSKRGASGE